MLEIDPQTRSVRTDRDSYDADVLVVALGAEYDIAATPGFATGGYEYYSLEGVERLRHALTDFESGTILIGVLGHPFKCPPAPFEGAFLLHDQLLKHGVASLDTDGRRANLAGGGSEPYDLFIGIRLLPPSTELALEKQQFGATRRQRWFGS